METAFFWIAWGIISYWALKTFYYSFSKEKINSLRKAVLGIHLAVLVLSFLPWLPPILGAKTGVALALEGNTFAVLFFILLVGSGLLFFSKEALYLKIGSTVIIINTSLLFVLMYQVRPGTFVLTLYDIAPIIAFMFLLVGDVIVLLLWQQFQLGKDKIKRRKKF